MAHRLNDLIPMLICRDVPKMIDFYTGVLDFRIVNRMDDVGRSGWASLRNGRTQIMFASPSHIPVPDPGEEGHRQVMYYFYPEDVVKLHAAVRDAGYPCTDMVVRFYGMKEFELKDPEGHLLVFGQDTDEPPAANPHDGD